ncbi:Helix-turn-helix [Serratia fonticola]|uniref:Helix-turn-helix n=1 Tax=Serratia fonticola TaxID=47917 RepID=A0A4U9USI1_SERFO|nr:Helix-turn-helix [Serratia fonticola]
MYGMLWLSCDIQEPRQLWPISSEERDFFIALGKRHYRLRKERTITQTELAEQLGVSQQTVQAWGGWPPSYIKVSSLPAVANIFSVSLEELFGSNDGVFPPRECPDSEVAAADRSDC